MENTGESKTDSNTTVQTEPKKENENQEENIHLSHVKIKRNNEIILLPFGEISDFEKYYKAEKREKARARITPQMKINDKNCKKRVRDAAKILEELVFDYKIEFPKEFNDRIFNAFEPRFRKISKTLSDALGMLDLIDKRGV